MDNNDLQTRAALVFNALMTRAAIQRAMNPTDQKDIDGECEYPDVISIDDYWRMYTRMGTARRLIRLFPKECWKVLPAVYETEKTGDESPFEIAVNDLIDSRRLLAHLQRADELSGVGFYGVVVLGIGDGLPLDQPVRDYTPWQPGGRLDPRHSLLYLKPFSQKQVRILEYEGDSTNPRYGLPTYYEIDFSGDGLDSVQVHWGARVHWHRVIHLAQDKTSSEVEGTPVLEDVYNILLNLKKLLGGSAEMFWKGAFPGLSFEGDKELLQSMVDQSIITKEDIEHNREQVQAYELGLQRYLMTLGVNVKSLAVQVADPRGHIEVQLNEISITKAVPKRVLLGSERGELASSQDAEAWDDRVRGRQSDYLTPEVIRPTIDRLIEVRVLPAPTLNYKVYWPDISAPSEGDKANVAKTVTETLALFVKGNVEAVIDLRNYFHHILGWELDVIDVILQSAMERFNNEDTAGVDQ